MPAPVALLVEDSREYAVIGANLLKREGFDVVVAADGETGVGLARVRRPELVLLDVSPSGASRAVSHQAWRGISTDGVSGQRAAGSDDACDDD
jgi:DNA-binding response OmpR family regulator